MVFLTALSAYTSDPINLFLRGESSIGKTYNVIQALKYFPKDDVWLLGGLSPTALVHSRFLHKEWYYLLCRGKLVDEHGEEINFETLDKKTMKQLAQACQLQTTNTYTVPTYLPINYKLTNKNNKQPINSLINRSFFSESVLDG